MRTMKWGSRDELRLAKDYVDNALAYAILSYT